MNQAAEADKRWTPERAKQADKRWRRAGMLIALIAAVLPLAGFDMLTIPLLVAAHLCLVESAQQHGWRIGYAVGVRGARQGVAAPGGEGR